MFELSELTFHAEWNYSLVVTYCWIVFKYVGGINLTKLNQFHNIFHVAPEHLKIHQKLRECWFELLTPDVAIKIWYFLCFIVAKDTKLIIN